MTLLVDNQLPVALARYLAANGWECAHVQDIGLDLPGDSTDPGVDCVDGARCAKTVLRPIVHIAGLVTLGLLR